MEYSATFQWACNIRLFFKGHLVFSRMPAQHVPDRYNHRDYFLWSIAGDQRGLYNYFVTIQKFASVFGSLYHIKTWIEIQSFYQSIRLFISSRDTFVSMFTFELWGSHIEATCIRSSALVSESSSNPTLVFVNTRVEKNCYPSRRHIKVYRVMNKATVIVPYLYFIAIQSNDVVWSAW